jgi:hypothetical protein
LNIPPALDKLHSGHFEKVTEMVRCDMDGGMEAQSEVPERYYGSKNQKMDQGKWNQGSGGFHRRGVCPRLELGVAVDPMQTSRSSRDHATILPRQEYRDERMNDPTWPWMKRIPQRRIPRQESGQRNSKETLVT